MKTYFIMDWPRTGAGRPGSVGKVHRRPESEQFLRLAKTAKQAILVLSSMEPDAARRKKGRSKPGRLFRHSLGLRFLLVLRLVLLSGSAASARFLDAKEGAKQPRARLACPPSSSVGTVFANPEKLGKHGYRLSLSEKSGIVYTDRGGHIDIAHTRKIADWTAYLAYQLRETLRRGGTDLSYRMWEPSRHHVTLTYPPHWTVYAPSVQEDIIEQIAIALGQHLAFRAATWHEILTWFGYRGIGIWPEYQSAFSWEDNYSNLLGCHIAARALQDPQHDYDRAVTSALEQELQRLGIQPRRIAVKASRAMRGTWFKGDLIFLSIFKRHLDIGVTDGMISPWIVTCLPELAGTSPEPLPLPDLRVLFAHGFAFQLEIEPRELEKHKILKIVYPELKDRPRRIEPERHFSIIMHAIRAQAVRRYGADVELAYTGRNHLASASPASP